MALEVLESDGKALAESCLDFSGVAIILVFCCCEKCEELKALGGVWYLEEVRVGDTLVGVRVKGRLTGLCLASMTICIENNNGRYWSV